MKLVDYIGKPALLEQCAEECVELAHACLKMARFLRDENKVHGKTKEDLYKNLHEEAADVTVSMREMLNGDILDQACLNSFVDAKTSRMRNRIYDSTKRYMVYGIDSEYYSSPIVIFFKSYSEAKKWLEEFNEDYDIHWDSEVRCKLINKGCIEDYYVFEIFVVNKPYILMNHTAYDGVYFTIKEFDCFDDAYNKMYKNYDYCMKNFIHIDYDSCWFNRKDACLDDNYQWHYWTIIDNKEGIKNARR